MLESSILRFLDLENSNPSVLGPSRGELTNNDGFDISNSKYKDRRFHHSNMWSKFVLSYSSIL